MTNLSKIANFSFVSKKKNVKRAAHYFEVTNARTQTFCCAFNIDEAMEIFHRFPEASLWISSTTKAGYVSKRKLVKRKQAFAYEL